MLDLSIDHPIASYSYHSVVVALDNIISISECGSKYQAMHDNWWQ